MNLDDTHILITGGTAGIGLALAVALERENARVTVCGRSEERLEEARRTLSERAHVTRCDVSRPENHAALLADAVQANGPIDILINNAGVQQLMDFTDDAQQKWIASEVGLNLTAPLLLTEAALPALRLRPEPAVVQITSGLALSPKRTAPVYCATKAGLRSFTQALRWQLEGDRVRIIEVLPPLVETEMTEGRGSGKLSPEEAARQIVSGLRAGREEIFVGKAKLLHVIHAISPWLAGRITRRM
jgi:uncharacterized oxidoreductase